MRTSQLIEESTVDSMLAAKAQSPLVDMYRTVRQSISESRRGRHFDAIWARLAPTGNIYRYLGFRLEHSRHCLDLECQLANLAVKHQDLLGGEAVPLAQRAAKLRKLLAQTSQKNLPSVEEGEDVVGFPPLEEFLGNLDVKAGGVIGVLQDPQSRAQWRTDHLMAVLVCTIQVVAPILIFIHNWYKDENQLRDPKKLMASFTLKEATCLGESLSAELTTVMGTMMLVVINTIILGYAQAEQENAQKLGRIPMDNFWLLCSTVANATCCLFISLAIPLEFWSEDGPTGIVMNAMALLFIFSFDDLSSDAFGYLGKDDAAFQREISWGYALLSHCPIELSDLINSQAKRGEDLWQIAYDGAGRLRASGPEAGPCATRIALAEKSEATPLAPKEDEEEEEETLPDIRYQVTPGGPVRRLPGWRNSVSKSVWATIVLLLNVIWWVVPVVWFVVNKPCQDAAA